MIGNINKNNSKKCCGQDEIDQKIGKMLSLYAHNFCTDFFLLRLTFMKYLVFIHFLVHLLLVLYALNQVHSILNYIQNWN